MMDTSAWMKPGECAQAPVLSESTVRDLIERHFGLLFTKLKRLDGYDDFNCLITDSKSTGANAHIQEIWPHGYMFKLTNPLEATVDGLIDGQCELIEHVRKQNFGTCVPQLVRTIDGALWVNASFTVADKENNFKEMELPVRLYKFIPGTVLDKSPMSAHLLFSLGDMIGRFRTATANFDSAVYHKYKTMWSAIAAPYAKQFAYLLPEARRDLVCQVFDKFEMDVCQIADNLPSGQIHGDINENNVLAKMTCEGGNDQVQISGLLDFCDSHRSCLFLEMAVAIAYMSLIESSAVDQLERGGHLLAGYLRHHSFTDTEFNALRVSVCARLSQSLTLGWYAYQQNPVPENQYVLSSSKLGWPLLEKLWNIGDNRLYKIWRAVIAQYNVTSN